MNVDKIIGEKFLLAGGDKLIEIIVTDSDVDKIFYKKKQDDKDEYDISIADFEMLAVAKIDLESLKVRKKDIFKKPNFEINIFHKPNINLEKQYLDLCHYIIQKNYKSINDNQVNCFSIFGKQIIHDMKKGFPIFDKNKVNFKDVLLELVWFLKGETNINFLLNLNSGEVYKKYVYKNFLNETIHVDDNDIRKIIFDKLIIDNDYESEFFKKIKTDNNFAKKWGNLGPVYGKQLRKLNYSNDLNSDYIDQISELVNNINNSNQENTFFVSYWNVAELNKMFFKPTHIGFQIFTEKLSIEEREEIFENKMEMDILEFPEDSDDLNYKHIFFNEKGIPEKRISIMIFFNKINVYTDLPYYLAFYGLLLELLSKFTNTIPDELILNLGESYLLESNVFEIYFNKKTIEDFSELSEIKIDTDWWQRTVCENVYNKLDFEHFLKNLENDNLLNLILENDIKLI